MASSELMHAYDNDRCPHLEEGSDCTMVVRLHGQNGAYHCCDECEKEIRDQIEPHAPQSVFRWLAKSTTDPKERVAFVSRSMLRRWVRTSQKRHPDYRYVYTVQDDLTPHMLSVWCGGSRLRSDSVKKVAKRNVSGPLLVSWEGYMHGKTQLEEYAIAAGAGGSGSGGYTHDPSVPFGVIFATAPFVNNDVLAESNRAALARRVYRYAAEHGLHDRAMLCHEYYRFALGPGKTMKHRYPALALLAERPLDPLESDSHVIKKWYDTYGEARRVYTALKEEEKQADADDYDRTRTWAPRSTEFIDEEIVRLTRLRSQLNKQRRDKKHYDADRSDDDNMPNFESDTSDWEDGACKGHDSECDEDFSAPAVQLAARKRPHSPDAAADAASKIART